MLKRVEFIDYRKITIYFDIFKEFKNAENLVFFSFLGFKSFVNFKNRIRHYDFRQFLVGTQFLTYFSRKSVFILFLRKVIDPKWTVFAFGNTYFHQTFMECVSNKYTHFDYQHARWEVMERLYCIFWVFSYIISTKLSQIKLS